MPGTEPDSPSEERLVAAVLEGDDEAFSILVGRHKRQVLRIAGRYSRSPEELEELGQEIFLKAYTDLRQYRGEAPLAHWLSRIAVRSCYDSLRKRGREIGTLPLDDEAAYLADDPVGDRDEAEAGCGPSGKRGVVDPSRPKVVKAPEKNREFPPVTSSANSRGCEDVRIMYNQRTRDGGGDSAVREMHGEGR